MRRLQSRGLPNTRTWQAIHLSDIEKDEPVLYDELLHRYHLLSHSESQQAAVSPLHDLHRQALKGNLKSIFELSEHYQQGKEIDKDQYLSFRLVKYAAEQGYQKAFSVLGKYHAYGIGTQQNLHEAAHWFQKTDYRDTEILALLAYCHHNGVGVPKDETKAYDLWLDAADQGHSEGFRFCQIAAEAGYARGQFTLGHFYQHGIGIPVNIQEALRLFHQSAEQNYVHAQCRLGILYSEGNYGIERDPVVAVQWFRLAADQNDSLALHWLAHYFEMGDGVEQNKDEAARMFRELAQCTANYPKGDPASQFRLAALLLNQEYAGYNPKEGLQWLQKAAQQNDRKSQSTLAMLYCDGFEDIVKQNLKEARRWFRKAAEQGDAVAQYYLGEMYFDGNGVTENLKAAFRWYKLASETGYFRAVQKVAHCYINGIGTPKNESGGYKMLASLAFHGDAEAGTLLRSAAVSGNPAAEYGMFAYHYHHQDLETGYRWLEKSADHGHAEALYTQATRYAADGDSEQKLHYYRLAAEEGNVEAQYDLGLALEDVFDKKAPTNEEAFKWMKAAADQGHARANYCLGNFYRSGTWVDSDPYKAFEHYSKAASMGDADGIDRLGECYLDGTAVPVNEHLAFQYFECAAQLGNPKGLCNLGLCHLHGIGCRQDTTIAFQWILRAADTGDPIVFKILQELGLDVSQLSAGYRRSQEVWSKATGDRLGGVFDKIFDKSKRSIVPRPPKVEEQ